MFSDDALAELITISDHIIITGDDYELSFEKEDVACDYPPEGGMIVFGFKYHSKTLFMNNITWIQWDINDLLLRIREERPCSNIGDFNE